MIQKHLYFLLVLLLAHSCGKTGNDPSRQFNAVLSDSDGTVNYLGGEFFLQVTSVGTWQAQSSVDWITVKKTSEATAVVKVARNRDESDRTGFIEVKSGSDTKTIRITQKKLDAAQVYYPSKEAYRIEVPRLSEAIAENKSQFVVHYAKDKYEKEVLNYSMEYNYDKRHSVWVAFVFDDTTGKDEKVGRSEAWQIDLKIPAQYRTDRPDYYGRDRGHLVASADRQFSYSANMQTFYYSNMSPQLNNFNAGIWQQLEQKVQNWGRTSSIRDTLYVVKGGTISDGMCGKYNRTVIPDYYFMALLARKGNKYRSVGFYLKHQAYRKPYRLENYTMSIKELEEKTGIDFFHNLPDDIEHEVEQQNYSLDWLKDF